MSVSIRQQPADTIWTGCLKRVDTQETDTKTNTIDLRQDTPVSAPALMSARVFGFGEKEANRCSPHRH